MMTNAVSASSGARRHKVGEALAAARFVAIVCRAGVRGAFVALDRGERERERERVRGPPQGGGLVELQKAIYRNQALGALPAGTEKFSGKNTIDLQWEMRAIYNARPCTRFGKAASARTMGNNEKNNAQGQRKQ